MRKIRTMIVAVMMLTIANVANAQYMTFTVMRDHARFLTDRMAFTLRLTPDVIDAVYMINYDYIYGVNEYLDDIALGYNIAEYNDILYHRDLALRRLLTPSQWALYTSYDYYYRPIVFANNGWRFSIYTYDRRPSHFYYRMPRHYHEYRGGHYFHPIRTGRRPNVVHHAPAHPAPNGPHRGPAHDNRRYDRPHGGVANPPQGNNGNRGGSHINHNADKNRAGSHNNPPQGNFNNRGNQGGSSHGSQNHGNVGNHNRGGNPAAGQNRGGGNAPRTIRTSTGGSNNGAARPASARGGRH